MDGAAACGLGGHDFDPSYFHMKLNSRELGGKNKMDQIHKAKV